MAPELLTICSFDDVWDTVAKGKDSIDSLEVPKKRLGICELTMMATGGMLTICRAMST